jgi:hypothetical protein
MLATFIPPGQGSFKSRKFSTVDELVKVIRSAPSARQTAARTGYVTRFRNCLVSKRFVHNRTHAAQLLGEQVPRLLCASNQNPQVFNAAGLLEFFDYCFGHEFLRLQIDMKMKSFTRCAVAGPIAAIFAPPISRGVIVKFEKDFEEGFDTIRAGENDPVIGMRILHQLGKFTKIARRPRS